jgi:putative N-acetyltransferase (TIGR04045 family)
VTAASWPSTKPARRPQRTWRCRPAASERELGVHFAVRRAVFVDEQKLFAGDDRDRFDDEVTTLHVVGVCGGEIGGVVRLYPLAEPGLWKGDRLAVLPPFRHGLLGAELVRFAVATAGARGGARMIAMIQVPNVRFFTELGWRPAGHIEPYHGVDHSPMDIELAPLSPQGR